jgi:YHS domain-containing protein
MKKALFLVLAVFFVFSLSEVTAQEKTKKGKKEKSSMVMKKDTTTRKGSLSVTNEKLICPVMNMDAKKEINYTYQGKKYYFCCKDCLEKFKANPEKYLKK